MQGSKYTQEQKDDARRRLYESGGDVELVSIQTGIPTRTLYRWRKGWQKKLPPLPTSIFGIPKEEFEASLEAAYQPGEYSELREELMHHIKVLSKTLSDDPDLAYRRAYALTRLLDRVIKLEHLTRVEKPQVTIIKYEYEDNTIHDQPPWQNEAYSRANQAFWKTLQAVKNEYYESIGFDNSRFTATVSPPEDGTIATENPAATTSPPEDGNSPTYPSILSEGND